MVSRAFVSFGRIFDSNFFFQIPGIRLSSALLCVRLAILGCRYVPVYNLQTPTSAEKSRNPPLKAWKLTLETYFLQAGGVLGIYASGTLIHYLGRWDLVFYFFVAVLVLWWIAFVNFVFLLIRRAHLTYLICLCFHWSHSCATTIPTRVHISVTLRKHIWEAKVATSTKVPSSSRRHGQRFWKRRRCMHWFSRRYLDDHSMF